MKAIEFQSKIENGKIKIPEENLKDFNRYIDSDLKVIVLWDENSKKDSFQGNVEEQFLKGYDDSDSIYDELNN
jgi:hypothetical protein